jgi:hypothetical protein
MANQSHSVTVTDKQIIAAYRYVRRLIKHTDAMTEYELAVVREAIPGDYNMLSLNWLRNRIVQLRKGGHIPTVTNKGNGR